MVAFECSEHEQNVILHSSPQFQQVFPKVTVRTISANKLLGLYGQDFPIPVSGHQIDEVNHSLQHFTTARVLGKHL
jgi:hypothetical protein